MASINTTEKDYYLDSNFIDEIATRVVDELLKKRMYILANKSLNDGTSGDTVFQSKTPNQEILCDIVDEGKPDFCTYSREEDMSAAGFVVPSPSITSIGGSKKRTVIIKSNILPKTVKGLKTRKKLLKKRIKKAEKKVKLSKNRIIRLK